MYEDGNIEGEMRGQLEERAWQVRGEEGGRGAEGRGDVQSSSRERRRQEEAGGGRSKFVGYLTDHREFSCPALRLNL